MTRIQNNITDILERLPQNTCMVCVSKFHPESEIMEAYQIGVRDFGESHVQELLRKYETLPKDIRWHMIGHLQTNKVRTIVPFVHLIQSVDSLHLMQTIEKEASKINRIIDILLEVHVSTDETKSGFEPDELANVYESLSQFPHIRVRGIMGMATLTEDTEEIARCFKTLHTIYQDCPITEKTFLSMGMSSDWEIALNEQSNMVRIGTTIFGQRQY